MAGIKLQKRKHDFFVSYGHADLPQVEKLVTWLHKCCGLEIWFDSAAGNAAERSSELLAGAIGNSRGALFLLSEEWKKSSWCKGEYEVALAEQRQQPGFDIVAAQLATADAPNWFRMAEIVDLKPENASGYARLLRSLTSEVPHRFDNEQDVYLAAPWSRPSELSSKVFGALRSTGWRLIGDSQDQRYQASARIEAIVRTTRGVVAVLPHAPEQKPYGTSPYIIDEAEIAIRCGKPLLLFAEEGVQIPEPLAAAAFRQTPVTLAAGTDFNNSVPDTLEAFDELLARQPHDDSRAFIFFAGSLREEIAESDEIVSVMERASNMCCIRGERVSGDNVQRAIIDLIRRAAMVVADVTGDRRNTLIEAGMAMALGTPLKLIMRAEGDSLPKKAFMFEGQECFFYRTSEERVGLCYSFAREVRRRVYVVR